MYLASLILLAASAVTLTLGLQAEGVGMFLVSTACSVLAAGASGLVVVRRLRRGRALPGT